MPPPVHRPQYLTPEQEATIREALASGATRREAAALAGITRRRLDTRLDDQLRDVRVGQGRRRGGKRIEVDPTPEEIAERAAEIRANWTPEQEYAARTNFTAPIDDA